MSKQILNRDFYLQKTQTCARGLIGKILHRNLDGKILSGIIYEAEAYDSEQDLACHARVGKTERNVVMYDIGGFAYIYFTYGMHWMLNCVTGPKNYPAAVLLRAIVPCKGIEIIKKNRSPIPEKHWTDGPAKLTKALSITGELNGIDLCNQQSAIYITEGLTIPDNLIRATARIGIDNTPEPWKSKKWRYIADRGYIETLVKKN